MIATQMPLGQMMLIVCPLVFIASFVDSIAGGGGLISLPAYMLTGLPIHVVCGTNKVSSGVGTIFSAIRFYRGGKMVLKTALISGVMALCGSVLGARMNMHIDGDLLKKLFLVVLPVVAVFVFISGAKRQQLKVAPVGRKLAVICGVIGFLTGMYDGLIGPGTGTFLIFGFTTFAGFDYVTASGNAKVANLASNLAGAVVYLAAGKVLWSLAIPAAVCGVFGGLLGSGMAIKKGAGFVRVIMVLVLIGVFGKLIYDMFI